jgi:hypothetical protein
MTTYIGIFHTDPENIYYSNNPKLRNFTEYYNESDAKVFICTSDDELVDIMYYSDSIEGILNQISNDKWDCEELDNVTQESLKKYIESTVYDKDSSTGWILFENGEPKWFSKEANLIFLGEDNIE